MLKLNRNSIIFFSLLFTAFLFFVRCGKGEEKKFILPPELPVQHNGRLKPLDSFAGNYLLTFYGRSSLKNFSAMEWLTELLLEPKSAYKRPIFRIQNPDTIAFLSLPKKIPSVYSFAELTPAVSKNIETISQIGNISPRKRSPAQAEEYRIYENLIQYFELSRSLSLILPDFYINNKELAERLHFSPYKGYNYLQLFRIRAQLNRLLRKKGKTITPEQKEALRLEYQLKSYANDMSSRSFRVLPPEWKKKNIWHAPWDIFSKSIGTPRTARYLSLFSVLAGAYRKKNLTEFKSAARNLQDLSFQSVYTPRFTLYLELNYNRVRPFLWSLVFYVLSFLFLFLGEVFKIRQKTEFSKKNKKKLWNILRALPFVLLLIGVVWHSLGIVARVVILSRAPVANLYESVLFVGLVSVLIGIGLEFKRKNGTGIATGAVLGVFLHLLAMRYSAEGDSMGMLTAVLNSNFWLTTHVLTISIGYGASLMAGVFAHIYIVKRIVGGNKAEWNGLNRSITAILVFALFFTVLGTLLGGIWADQSWGRFWGWDPKENGALLLCLYIIWLLHGRLGGIMKPDGFVIGALLTTVVTALSWFGVNLLSVGLHSYGFTNQTAYGLGVFIGMEILIAFAAYILFMQKSSIGVSNNRNSYIKKT